MKRTDKEILYQAFVHLATGILLILLKVDRAKAQEWGQGTKDFLLGRFGAWLERQG